MLFDMILEYAVKERFFSVESQIFQPIISTYDSSLVLAKNFMLLLVEFSTKDSIFIIYSKNVLKLAEFKNIQCFLVNYDNCVYIRSKAFLTDVRSIRSFHF